ncbi:MAG: secretin N-terminal domain-containing protein, partial [Thermodesulfovibrionales bacterium]
MLKRLLQIVFLCSIFIILPGGWAETPQEQPKPAQLAPTQNQQPVQPQQPQLFQPPQQPAQAPQPKEVPQKPQPIPQRQPTTRGGMVSFNFDDADVFSVIQTIFGDILKVNYIVDPNVKGRVNFRSTAPVPKEDVLPLMEVILRLNGISIVEEGGLYRIIPIAEIPKEPAAVNIGRQPDEVKLSGKAILQIVPVHYIQSSEMVRILTPFLSTNAVIVDVPKSNHIVIADTDANVKRMLQLVEIFDSEKLKQIKPQVFIYPVQNSKAKDVANMLQQIFLGARPTTTTPTTTTTTTPTPQQRTQPQQQPQPPPPAQPRVSMGPAGGGEALVSEITKIFPDEVTNSIIILATPEDYALISETIKKIDIIPRQVMIEGLIARVDLTDKLDFGMQWTIQNDFKITNIKPFNRDVNISGPLKLDSPITTPNFTFTAYDAAGNVKLLLQSLAAEGKAKILAAPHILVSDNREARIQVGSQIPIATQTTTTPVTGGTTPTSTITSTVQYKDVGIILKVKPQVNDSGLVSMEISQEVSGIGESVKIAGQDFQSITKTEATTNLVAKDGETIVIGGLIREDTTKSRAGIPILSKIPILGFFFGNTIDETTRNELIILLT